MSIDNINEFKLNKTTMQYSVRIPSGYQPQVNQALFNCGEMTKTHTNVTLNNTRYIIVNVVDLEAGEKVFKKLQLPCGYFPYKSNTK